MTDRISEREIRPAKLFDTYLALVVNDIPVHFDGAERSDLPCPSCSNTGTAAFTKLGFDYRECPECHTLWMSPRPSFDAFVSFYSNSASARYWAEVFYPAVEEVRRVKLWQPKARQVLEIAQGNGGQFRNVVDIGGGSGIFADELRKLTDMRVFVIEPSPESAAACRARGIDVLEQFLEDVSLEQMPAGPTIFTSFELFEHVYDPEAWLASVVMLMKRGDVLILTTLSGMGVDIQTLWENSPSVNPPHHINFLNPRSIANLGQAMGLTPIKVFTPGVLDLDIMRNNLEHVHDRFWRTLLATASDADISDWQRQVSSSGASSHMWAVFGVP